MNISVLAKQPSADVMAPAAVATRRIPQRGKEEARGSGPRCALGLCPVGPPAVPERGTQKGGGPDGSYPPRASRRTAKRSREAGASERAHGLGEPAPSVGFKRPLSAPGVAELPAAPVPLVLGAAWQCLAQRATFAHPTRALPPAPSSSVECPQVLTNAGPRIGRDLPVSRAASPMQETLLQHP